MQQAVVEPTTNMSLIGLTAYQNKSEQRQTTAWGNTCIAPSSFCMEQSGED